MEGNRRIRKVIRSRPTIEGAGVHLRRAFGFGETQAFDPFLLLDDFRSDNPRQYLNGFPWHPHRGIETVTCMLEGSVEHGDSLGNRGVIGPGDVQWMTAGSGIIHQEMPRGDPEGHMGGFQLWVNLPAAHKMMEPRYREIRSREIPVVSRNDGITIRVIAGRVGETRGSVRDIVTDPEYLDVTIPAGTEFIHPTPPSHTVFAYVLAGEVRFCRENDPLAYQAEGAGTYDIPRDPFAIDGDLVLFDEGEHLVASAGPEAGRFLLLSGKPLGEPVAWYGPIVMNTRRELEIAFEEYRQGTFIKHGAGGPGSHR